MNDDKTLASRFCGSFEEVQKMVYENAEEHGWWDNFVSTPANLLSKVCLMHSELSEAVEAIRERKEKSDKIDFTAVEEELADVIIRIMDFAEFMELDIAGAILAKNRYNITRPYRHGKEI